jgi:penicillin-binding protein 1A
MIPAPSCITIPLDGAPPWSPCNYGGTGGGTVTIAEGTVRSYNTLYAQLMMQVGPVPAMETATRAGVASPLEPVPSAVLGSNVVTALDMAAGYSTFANRGVQVPPVLVTRITRSDGTVLYAHRHEQTKVLDVRVVDTLTSILEQVVERGTGTRAQLDRPAAGKTGTTNDNKDAWFAGYTPELATAVWVGFPQLGPDGQLVRMEPPTTPTKVTGGLYPAQIWQRFMSSALVGRPPVAFPPPPPTSTVPPTTTPVVRTPLGPLVRVPDVVGLDFVTAADILHQAGFRTALVPALPGIPRDVVGAQSPWGGSAPTDSTVTLEVGQ